jgi:hypothetical protein
MTPTRAKTDDALFVATDLSILNDAVSPSLQDELSVEGRVYRRLDPEYYAWLRSRMETAQAACSRGKLPPETFDALRIRFNAIHDLAMAFFGESALQDAVRLLDPKSYPWPGHTRKEPEDSTHAEIPKADEQPAPRCRPEKPPGIPEEKASLDGMSRHSFPGEDPERFRFNQPVSKYALAQVDAIRDQALACGWTEAQLYQTRGRFAFPCGGDYGVVCLISRDQRLGKVTDKAIEIICSGGHSLRFYRKEVNQ